jgi:uncharacterized protein YuzE
VNFVYSTEADALYIELESPRPVARTAEVSSSCLVDLDEAGRPLGIELLAPATSYPSLLGVAVRRFRRQLGEQRIAQLAVYPYQSLTPQRPRRLASSAGRARVRTSARPEPVPSA